MKPRTRSVYFSKSICRSLGLIRGPSGGTCGASGSRRHDPPQTGGSQHQEHSGGPRMGIRNPDVGMRSGYRKTGETEKACPVVTAAARPCDQLMDTVKPLPMNAKIQSIYRYPVKGLSPEALTRVTLAVGRPLPADRALRDRERPLRLRPGGSAIFSEDALPDADEERAAGRARHPLRRGKSHPHRPPERRRGRQRRSAHAGGPRRDRGFFCPLQFRRTARPAEDPAG